MGERPLRILQVNTCDHGGGAAEVAWGLHNAYRERGHESWLAVGGKVRDDPRVLRLPHDTARSSWQRFWWGVHERAASNSRPRVRLSRAARALADPHGAIDRLRGREDFHHPGTWKLADLIQPPPDVVHAHNLHGDYFDLRVLPWLTRRYPVVLSLHDAWLLGGHCAHSFDCERWKTGCGECPDLTLYPAIRKDATGWNWRRKRDLYRKSRVRIGASCRWLLRKVEDSVLNAAVQETRVIPDGVDLSVFSPGDVAAARQTLGLPQKTAILLFVAKAARGNRWKDFETIRAVAGRVGKQRKEGGLILLVVGDDAPTERLGNAEIRFSRPAEIAPYYQAADLYVHAAHADTFPHTILEALACGVPAVATAVGGIPEQIRPGDTGILVPPRDPEAMAQAVLQLLDDVSLRRRMSDHAARDARARFGLNRQADGYLEWFHDILQKDMAARTR